MYTSHGHWVGHTDPAETEAQPPRVHCGGPHRCVTCAIEAHRGQQATEE